MCNLYSFIKGQAAVREIARVMVDRTGNLPPMTGIYPDYPAPIVRHGPEGRELAMVRWGMPTPPSKLVGKKTDPGVTNIRTTTSSHWRRWLGPQNRCVVPFTSFSEYRTTEDGKKVPVWFALGPDRPLGFFAGAWTSWTSTRKVKEGEITCDLFAFLTTDPNAEVGAIHPKAMPLILRTSEEIETWMNAPAAEALQLQKPLPDGTLQIIAEGQKQDG